MFSKDGCNRPVFNASMSLKHFEILLSSLRFDDAETHPQRKTVDKAATISEVFIRVLNNSWKMHCCSENVTIDERC